MTEDSGDAAVPQAEIKKGRTSVAGVDLGTSGDSPKSILGAFGEKKVDLHRTTIPNLRSGRTAGTKIEERILAGEVLGREDASKKDELYLEIAQKGVEIRRPQKPPNSHKFNSEGFTDELGRNFDLKPQPARRLIRAMRADMVYTQQREPDAVFAQSFKSVADEFLNAYTKKGDNTSTETKKNLEIIKDAWAGDVGDFYKKLYGLGPRVIGAWTPFEMEALSEFYTARKAGGSKLTAFDKLILEARNQRRGTTQLTERIRESTGVPIDHKNIEAHRNALLYSRS